MQGTHPHLRAYLWLLVILVIVLCFCYGLYEFFIASPAEQQLPAYPSDLPQLTPQDSMGDEQSAQYLVSYTVSGLHPASLTVHVDQSVRFINDSPNTVVIAGAGTQSSTLQHGSYWQYTATKIGTLSFTAGNSTVNVTIAK